MSDWIEQLERLTRLHKEGALTDAEFAAQKARLLESQNAPSAAAEPMEYDDGVYEAPRPKWPLYAGLAAVAAVVIGGAAWFGSGIVPGRELPAAAASPTASAPVAEPSVLPTEAAVPVALDDTLSFSAAADCKAGDTLERIYKKLAAGMDIGSGQGLTIELEGFAAPLQIVAKNGKDKDGADTASADVRFPQGTTWHGLNISRVTTSRYYPPESDGADSRTVNFLEPVDKVRRTLARLGFAAPAAPDYTPIDEGQGCGGAMQIEARPGGSALVCTWGC